MDMPDYPRCQVQILHYRAARLLTSIRHLLM
jgi:hypothetical protein